MNLLQKLDAHHIVLLCHHNADPDALCSAYALSVLLGKVKSNLKVEIVASQGLSKISKQILKTVPMRIETTFCNEGQM